MYGNPLRFQQQLYIQRIDIIPNVILAPHYLRDKLQRESITKELYSFVIWISPAYRRQGFN